MTVASDRTLSNARDSGRKWPTSALADKVLTAAEGTIIEKIQGPTSGGTRLLGQPASSIALIQEYVTATGVLVGIRLATTHYTVNLSDPANGGRAKLTEAAASDRSANTWVVFYSPVQAEGTVGGQSDVGR